MEKIAVINLGCPKNLVDAEVMCGHLTAAGYELTADAEAADAVVVNTCGFLQGAAQEAVDTLLEAARWKQSGRCRAVIAAGCMTQRYGAGAAEAMPEVDGFLGVGQAHQVPDVVRRALEGERPVALRGPAAGFEGYGLRLQATPPWTAYVKVSEGCDRRCAFCTIPSIRGPMVSRPVEGIAAEVEALVARGTREIILIGQDPTRYGMDRGEGHRMVALLERLNAIPDLRWVRVMYLFPDRHAEPVLEAIGGLPKVCDYVDMPLQHVAEPVLRAMNRPGSGPDYRRMLATFRRSAPRAWVRSTFLVGFPGETRRDYLELLEFVREGEIDWLGGFRYSREDGTPAAGMPDPVSARTAERRYEELMSAQRAVVARRLRARIGSEVEVLVESVPAAGVRRSESPADTGTRVPTSGSSPDSGPMSGAQHTNTHRPPCGHPLQHSTPAYAVGRVQGQAPDVDGETLLDTADLPDCRPGDFVCATITGARGYDLLARATGREHRSPRSAPELLQIRMN